MIASVENWNFLNGKPLRYEDDFDAIKHPGSQEKNDAAKAYLERRRAENRVRHMRGEASRSVEDILGDLGID